MVYPGRLLYSLTRYLLRQKLRGIKKFPWVLMLEPLFRCNLSCSGCGRIREYGSFASLMLSPEQCLEAAREAGAPIVCLTGGEPLLHPGIDKIVSLIAAEGFYIFLSTNGILLESSLNRFNSNPNLCFVVHLDGLRERHDALVGKEGVFDAAVSGIRAAKERGFRVHVNTTVYKGSNPEEVGELFIFLASLGVDGVIVSPGYSYEAVEADVFLSRREIREMFQRLFARRYPGVKFYNTPLYFDFLQGKRELSCTPWSSPTRNPLGWRSPCYLLGDRHFPSFSELMAQTPWEKYGAGNDPRCSQCLTHCGYEASAISAIRGLRDIWRLLRWQLTGR